MPTSPEQILQEVKRRFRDRDPAATMISPLNYSTAKDCAAVLALVDDLDPTALTTLSREEQGRFRANVAEIQTAIRMWEGGDRDLTLGGLKTPWDDRPMTVLTNLMQKMAAAKLTRPRLTLAARDELRKGLLVRIYESLGPDGHGSVKDLAIAESQRLGGTEQDAEEAFEYWMKRGFFEGGTSGWGVSLSPSAVDRVETELRKRPAASDIPSRRQSAKTKTASRKLYGERWRIVGNLGGGGQSQTFVVVDVNDPTESTFVLKRLSNPERIARFAIEIKAALALDHPRILKVVDHRLSPDKAYLVTAYYPRRHLTEAHVQALNLPQRLALFSSICEALCHAHTNNITHRDLKPENILLSVDGDPVVADFGICYIKGEERVTEPLEVVGSRFCTPPELEGGRSENVDPRSDVYCLGKLFYWMLTGRHLPREMHHDPTYDLTLKAPRSAHALIYELLDRMITPSPASRLTSACEVATALASTVRRIAMNAHPIDINARQECNYCGMGAYQMMADPRWWEARDSDGGPQHRKEISEAFTRLGLTGNYGQARLMLVCDYCGNVQLFVIKNDRWWSKAPST